MLFIVSIWRIFHSLWKDCIPTCSLFQFSIPWGHHRYIIDKCSNDPGKALFYVRQTLENGWSRDVLLNVLGTQPV